MAEHAWILAAVPGIAFIVMAAFGRNLPRQGDWLAVLCATSIFALFFAVLANFLNLGEAAWPVLNSIEWTAIGDFHLRMGIAVDQITIVMLAVITTVALMVNIFSVGYMKGEPRYWWYFAVLQLFVASMLMLVLADNLLLLYVAWELVGLSSFLLIGHYWERRSAVEAAKKAFITTRVGDVGLLIGIILFWEATGTFNILDIIHYVEEGAIGDTRLFVTMMFILLGAMGKSAQLPFHVWLPDAMEGPTPVSALIHAATMVVAGVYLVARMLPVFELAGDALTVVMVVGLLTALFSGVVAFAQTDIKKVLAYSTVSQLGFMFVALGAGYASAGMFHLFTHAFFKALLFLGAGSVIIGTHHHQEMGQLGGLWRKMPITAGTFLIGSLALAGLFPLAGFWSKDEILHAVEGQGTFFFFLISIAAIMTAFYTARLFVRTFLGKPQDEEVASHTRETGPVMTLPLVFLALMSIVAGFFIFHDFGSAFGFPGGFSEFVFLHYPAVFHVDWGLVGLSTALFVIGTFGGAWFYWNGRLDRSTVMAEWQPKVYEMVRRKFYFDDLYQFLIDRVVLGFSYLVSWFDRFAVNDTGVDGSATLTGYTGFLLKHLQTGRVPNYAMAIAAGVVALTLLSLAVGS
ncbi:MAG: NADH-quinone oxidoreductase subunit L [Dehalococcoidia bacterium]|nr:NADH-quinone oxidoreductase subunit L [Dehalococcoidia bacterium]